jgi:hypothetical protein
MMYGLYEQYILSKQPETLEDALILFDENTKGLDSSSPHVVEWGWVDRNLCWSQRRHYLVDRLRLFIKTLSQCNVVIEIAILGGSFVSRKDDPKDIDALLIYRASDGFDPSRLASLAASRINDLDVRLVPSDAGLVPLLKASLFYSVLFQGRKGGEGAIMVLV